MKPYEPEEFSGDTRWILNAYPVDGKEWEKFEKSGLQQIPKEDANGEKFIRFRRSVRKIFPKDDEATYYNPPKLTGKVQVSYVDKETREEIRSYKKSEKREIERVGDEIAIGNGSVGLINLAVYDSGKGKGHRWESLNVLELVEYNPDAKSEEPKVPEPEKETTAVKKGTKSIKDDSDNIGKKVDEVKEDMNDEIPW